MRLARLRHQMLIAMGIPACWTGSTAPPTPPPQPPPLKIDVAFDGTACPRDAIVESVCGTRRETARTCGRKGSMLQSVDESKLYITPEPDDAEPFVTFRDFAFDREATRVYRDGIDDASGKSEACCYSQCTSLAVGVAGPVTLAPGFYLEEKCMPAPPNGTRKPAKEDPACPVGVAFDGVLRPYTTTQDGECCYSVPTQTIKMRAIPGRALRVDGVPQVAEIGHGGGVASAGGVGDGWRADLQPNLDIADDVRRRLARVWLETAQLEHASIAAFASLSLRLVAAGAPAQLIAAAHAAALDEVKHARFAFELASAYAGERFAPGRFDVAARAAVSSSVAELAIETFVDGCINETAAAHQAELAAEQALDPVVATALREIADDEARHAALAWAVVAWCVREGGVTVGDLRALARSGGSANDSDRDSDGDLACYGVLGDAATAAIRENVLREVVEPCIAALAA